MERGAVLWGWGEREERGGGETWLWISGVGSAGLGRAD